MDPILRILCVFFGLSDAVGAIWYQDTMTSIETTSLSIAAFCELFIGMFSYTKFVDNDKKYVYVSICIAGILCSLYVLYYGLTIEYGINWFVVVIRIMFIVIFYSQLQKIMRTNGVRD